MALALVFTLVACETERDGAAADQPLSAEAQEIQSSIESELQEIDSQIDQLAQRHQETPGHADATTGTTETAGTAGDATTQPTTDATTRTETQTDTRAADGTARTTTADRGNIQNRIDNLREERQRIADDARDQLAGRDADELQDARRDLEDRVDELRFDVAEAHIETSINESELRSSTQVKTAAIDARIERLRERSAEADADDRDRYTDRIDQLAEERAEMQQELEVALADADTDIESARSRVASASGGIESGLDALGRDIRSIFE